MVPHLESLQPDAAAFSCDVEANNPTIDWQKPSKKHTASLPSPQQVMEVTPFENSFAPLNLKIHVLNSRKNNTSIANQLQQSTINDDVPDKEGNSDESSDKTAVNTNQDEDKLYSGKYCPPIIMRNVDIRKLLSDFKESPIKFSYKIVNKGNSSRLYVDNCHVHRELMSTLRSTEDAEAYSFTLKEDKTTNVVLRGLTSEYPPLEILNELKSKFPNVSEVSHFETLRSKQEKIKYNLFLVRLLPGSSASDLIKLKYIFHTRVYWEKPRGNRGPLQCRRCQQFGHLAKNCAFAYKCVKCNSKHEPGLCHVVKEQGSKAVCVNCGGDHPANFRGCKTYKIYEARKKQLLHDASLKRDQAKNLSLAISRGAAVVPGISFSSHFNSQNTNVYKESVTPSSPKINRSGNVLGQFIELSNELFGISMKNLIGKISNFMSNLGNFRCLEDKQMAYFELLTELISSSSK